jgi:4-amino-4-deoxy-L-arabinose transferase-like glycosyltransferase
MNPNLTRTLEVAAVTLLLCLFGYQCLASMRMKSITYDETTYYGIGKDILERGSWEAPLASDQPPLSYYVHSLPLLGRREDELADRKRLGYPHLPAARRAMLPVALLLGLGTYLWSRSLMGRTAGLLTLVLYAFSPNMLAHSRLITPDVTLTCFYVWTSFVFWLSLRRHTWYWTAATGAALGLALLAKFTAVLLLPCLIVTVAIETLRRRLKPWDAAKRLGIMAAVSLTVVNAGYGFRGVPVPLQDHALEGARLSALAHAPVLRRIPVPLPLLYTRGFTHQYSIVQAGFPGFLMGEHSRTGWWYYFIIALAIKTPPALHVAVVAALVLVAACKSHPLRTQGAGMSAVVLPPLVLLFYASFLNHINIGLRYVLPVLPFLQIAAGALVAGTTCLPTHRRIAGAAVALCSVASALSVYPHYLEYFNSYIGGPRNGYRYLIDSNLDWGQDRLLLRRYVERSAVPVKVEPGCEPATGLIAVSANTLQGIYGDTGECYRWLKPYKPVDYVGYSWLIFDVPDSLPNGESRRPRER